MSTKTPDTNKDTDAVEGIDERETRHGEDVYDIPSDALITAGEVRELVAQECAKVRKERVEEIERVEDEVEELQDEIVRLKRRVGLAEAERDGVPEDLPALLRYESLPERDREERLSANKQRAVDVWALWDVYASKGERDGEKVEHIHVKEIRRILRTREGGEHVNSATIDRVLDFLERMSEGMLEVRESPTERQGRVVELVQSVDEWRASKYEREERERERRKQELKEDAREDVERLEQAKTSKD